MVFGFGKKETPPEGTMDITESGSEVKEFRPAEEVGKEVFDRAKRRVANSVNTIIGAVGHAGRFLGRLGLSTLGVPTVAKELVVDEWEATEKSVRGLAEEAREGVYAGGRAIEGGVKAGARKTGEAYRHTSEVVKSKALKAGERTRSGWEHFREFDREITDRFQGRIDKTYSQTHDGLVGGVNNLRASSKEQWGNLLNRIGEKKEQIETSRTLRLLEKTSQQMEQLSAATRKLEEQAERVRAELARRGVSA